MLQNSLSLVSLEEPNEDASSAVWRNITLLRGGLVEDSTVPLYYNYLFSAQQILGSDASASIQDAFGFFFYNSHLSDLQLVFSSLPFPPLPGTESDSLEQNGTEHTFPVHRVILSVRSEYFQTMFQSGMAESSAKEVRLYNLDYQVFSLYLELLYKCNSYPALTSFLREKVKELVISANEDSVLELIMALIETSYRFQSHVLTRSLEDYFICVILFVSYLSEQEQRQIQTKKSNPIDISSFPPSRNTVDSTERKNLQRVKAFAQEYNLERLSLFLESPLQFLLSHKR